jgi:hypothetical protein
VVRTKKVRGRTKKVRSEDKKKVRSEDKKK